MPQSIHPFNTLSVWILTEACPSSPRWEQECTLGWYQSITGPMLRHIGWEKDEERNLNRCRPRPRWRTWAGKHLRFPIRCFSELFYVPPTHEMIHLMCRGNMRWFSGEKVSINSITRSPWTGFKLCRALTTNFSVCCWIFIWRCNWTQSSVKLWRGSKHLF